MKIDDFLTEQWMNDYEHLAKVNLTDTSVQALAWNELYDLAKDHLKDIRLDYGGITGDPKLRKKILSFYQNQNEDTLTLCQGALNGCELVMQTLLEPGDHVITIKPGYQQYSSLPKWLQAKVTEVSLDEKDWSLPIEDLEKAVKENSKLVVFANPSNPTGTWLDQKEMEKLIGVCRKHDLWLLCDEVYRPLDDEALSVSDLYEKGIASASLSKLYGLAGLRLGWIKGDPKLIQQINVLRDYTWISTGPVIDQLALAALENLDLLGSRAQAIIHQNRQDIEEWLKGNPDFSCVLPEKGTVCFLKYHDDLPSSWLAKKLLEKEGIFFVPGSCFGMEGYLRLGLGQKHENLPASLQKLGAAYKQLKDEYQQIIKMNR